MSRRSARHGFTLREMFAVLTGICALFALLVPWIQSSREAARRTDCNQRLGWIVIALRNYHDTFNMFPMGAMHSGLSAGGDPPVNAPLGPSWWLGSLPFNCGDRRIFDEIVETQEPGGPARHQFCADDMTASGVRLLSHLQDFMRCPSSTLPLTEAGTGPIVLPSFVGIAGGCDIDSNSQEYRPGNPSGPGLVPTAVVPVYDNEFKGTGAAAGGIVTSSGLLPPCQHVSTSDCLDGTANTIIVAEQSGWLFDQNPNSSRKYHGDAGWTVGGTGPGGGWLSGTTRVDPVPQVDTPGGPPATWGADCWNITTVRYRPNFKRVMGAMPLPGCSENHGINNPLQSAHPGGLSVGMADGSVQFVDQTMDLEVLLRMAIRNDGQRLTRETK